MEIMCEVVNPAHQQQSSTVPLSLQHQASTTPGQQVPLMYVMATGGYGQTQFTGTMPSANGQYAAAVTAAQTLSPTQMTAVTSTPNGHIATTPPNCSAITTIAMPNGTQAPPMATLIAGHHTMAFCPTPPPTTTQQQQQSQLQPNQPATTTIYTLHTIGASTNFIQLQPANSPAGAGATTHVTPIQQHHHPVQSLSTPTQAHDAIDYFIPSTPIPIPATPTYHIEVPAHTLRIELGPFKSASELCAEPGDIIEIDRTLFSHWAIYVGSGDVVHIVGSDTQEVPDSERAIVQRLPLIQVAGDCPCRVNNKTLRARERNFLPFHNEIVVCKALSKVGTTVPYNALKCNSEHYVTEWKYGHRWSDQAQFNLNSFKALRRPHANSVTESHQLFVNTLNEVLNSPANSGSSLSGLNSTPTSTTTLASSSNSSLSLSTSPPRRSRQMSVSEHLTSGTGSSPTPPPTSCTGKGANAFQARLTRAMSASTFSTGVQTELSLL